VLGRSFGKDYLTISGLFWIPMYSFPASVDWSQHQ
jgi:hypothetical protein